MNSKHSIKEAGQEVSYLADRVHQVGGEVQSPRLVEVVFLNGLPREYESSRQLLEFHAKMLDQMIETLSAAEARMKGEKELLYGMDIVMESARLSKAEWIKKAKCYNCGELGHLLRHCKKPKKDQKSDSPDEKNDKKTEDKKPGN